MAKNQKFSDLEPTQISNQSLKDFLGLDLAQSSDKKLCPVGTLKHYVHQTQDMREEKKKLFISFNKNKIGDITQATVSSWLRNTIQLAYQLQADKESLPEGSRPHQV